MRAKDLTDGKEPVSHAEVDYLKELASTLPENPVIVNIGAATGVSTLAFLEERPDCFIYSVDINECEQELEHVKQGGHDVRQVVRLLGDSKLIGPKFPYKCNMLFVDGDHWNAAGDIEAWVETGKVKSGGVIAFHDYQEVCAPNNPGSVYEHVNAGMIGYEKLGEVDRVIAFRMP
jgi:predicted O-methyltransferase YrrM